MGCPRVRPGPPRLVLSRCWSLLFVLIREGFRGGPNSLIRGGPNLLPVLKRFIVLVVHLEIGAMVPALGETRLPLGPDPRSLGRGTTCPTPRFVFF